MRHERIITAVVCSALLLGLAGCTKSGAGVSGVPGKAVPAVRDDRAGSAIAAARAQMESIDGQAVPVMVGSAGVAMTPPPEQWSVMFVSPAKGRVYSVSVSHDKADAPREMGESKAIPAENVSAALDYDTLKVGSDEAFASAKSELAKSGSVPPQAMMNLPLISMPNLPDYKPGVWQISFLNGTSQAGKRVAEVDAWTGDISETTK